MAAFAAGIVLGCNHNHTSEHQHEAPQEQTEPAVHSHTENGVQLNNGARWAANPETTQGITNMLSLVETAQKSENVDAEALRTTLFSEFKIIFQKCTMEGEAHDQLHNYLHPLKDQIETMQATPEELEELKMYLQSYNSYFE